MTDKLNIEKAVWESTLKASMDRAGRIEVLEDENAQLKELLKECREKLNSCCPVLYSHLINQIDEVLK